MAGINLLERLNTTATGPISVKEPTTKIVDIDGSGSTLSAENRQALMLFLLGLGLIFGSNFLIEDYTRRRVLAQQEEVAVLEQKMQLERKRANDLKDIKAEADRYQSTIDDLLAKLKKVESLGENRNFLVRAIDFVVQEMPKTIWISDVKINVIDSLSMTLKGRATKLQEVSMYMQKLQPGSFFTNWSLLETRREENKDVAKGPVDAKAFEITAKVVGP